MSGYPVLRGDSERGLAFDQRRAMAGWAGRTDRYSVRTYLGEPAVKRNGALSDEPRPGLISRLACHYGIHRWVTMTTGRAGFVKFQRCDRGCGDSRVVKGRAQ